MPIKFYSILDFRLALAPSEHELKMLVLATTLFFFHSTFCPQFSFIQHVEQRNCSLPRILYRFV